jgi:type 1 glutamine amidotransferase
MMNKFLFIFSLFGALLTNAQPGKQWVTYEGADGPGKGKHIVFISGDEEYRSEESLPMLARILSKKYGFTCTVLFAIDPQTGEIDAINQTNIPGLQTLRNADLMVIFTRFRELPDNQMKYIDEYIGSGKPVVGLRTSTHAFAYKRNPKSIYAKYSFDSKATGWENGFGKKILGETWIAHHGEHGKEGTRGLIDGIQQQAKNPILNGVKDIWTPTDVYAVKKLDRSSDVLIYGQSTNGMTAEAPVNLDKSVMPVAWTRTYSSLSGKKGKVFTTTMGASIDMLNEDLRRLIVNACFWAVDLEKKIPEKADVNFVGDFKPTMFGFDSFKKGSRPEKYE